MPNHKPVHNPTPIPEDNVWVISGNYQEYLEYVHRAVQESKYKGKRFRYVASSDTFRGIEKPHGVCIGTWKERSDIMDVMQTLWNLHNHEGDKVRDLFQQAIDYQKQKLV